MPLKPSITCNHPGCPHLAVKSGYCDRHQGTGPQRDKTVQKLYNHRWQRASKAYLAGHPWCCDCLKEGHYTPATQVHHKKKHLGNQTLFWLEENWMGLCASCHSKRTAQGE